jgi:calmodulin
MTHAKASSEVIDAFRVFDRTGNGRIALNDFLRILRNFGDPLTQYEINEIVAEAQPSKSGEINYIEFVQRIDHIYPQS